jgi:D-alanine-D-alanine ligase
MIENSKKLRVGILFGGKSSEHEVSLLSAKSVIDALDKEKYEPVLISIDKSGKWHIRDALSYLEHADNPKEVQLHGFQESLAIFPHDTKGSLVAASSNKQASVDVVFPVLHGKYGEDGTMQGLLRMLDIPFVGADVLSSAICMDKEMTKRLLKEAGFLVGRFIVVRSEEKDQFTFEHFVQELGLPFFVKPSCAGSSVGVSKVKKKEEFAIAVEKAFLYDRKILVEEFICGREIECSVLGGDTPIASLPGEVMPKHEFYSYEAKYLDDDGASFAIPVALDPSIEKLVQKTAVEAFKTLCCEAMARVDFFLTDTGRLFVNEINTIPGFTKISMYPKLWQASGLPYADLLDRLIQIALERKEKEAALHTAYKQDAKTEHS